MRQIKISKLTRDAFAPYGEYASIINPEGCKMGEPPVEFYRDMAQQFLGGTNTVSYSACVVRAKSDWIIENAEYHNFTCEAILCLDGDYLMHVAPACAEDEEPWDNIEVFLIPKGTLVVTRPGVWHQAGFPYGCGEVHILCALPERTYANDCVLKIAPEDKRIRVLDEMKD
ncbi:MAG: ureidoglycolate lyase [Burkholderiales bacterium]